MRKINRKTFLRNIGKFVDMDKWDVGEIYNYKCKVCKKHFYVNADKPRNLDRELKRAGFFASYTGYRGSLYMVRKHMEKEHPFEYDILKRSK